MGARPLGRVDPGAIKKPLADEVLIGKLRKAAPSHPGLKPRKPARPGSSSRRLAGELPVQSERRKSSTSGCPQAPQEDGGERSRSPRPAEAARGGRRQRRTGRSCPAARKG